MVTTTLVLSGVASAALLFAVALTAVGAAFAAILTALWLFIVYPKALRLGAAMLHRPEGAPVTVNRSSSGRSATSTATSH